MNSAIDDKFYDAVVVGGAGVGVAIALRYTRSENRVALKRHSGCTSYATWPAETRRISHSNSGKSYAMPDPHMIGVTPAYSQWGEHPTDGEYAAHLHHVGEYVELPICEIVDVKKISKIGGIFRIDTADATLCARHVIWANDEIQSPNLDWFVGNGLYRHGVMFPNYGEPAEDDFVVFGGFERRVDAACRLDSRIHWVRSCDNGYSRNKENMEPSIVPSTYSRERLRPSWFNAWQSWARCWRAAVVSAFIMVGVMLNGCAATTLSANATVRMSEVASAPDTFALLHEATDHEALYTLVGGLKPMSTGIWGGSFVVDDPDLADLCDVRLALAPLCNDVWYADVQVFDYIDAGQRSAHAFVVHRMAMARMIERFEAFWSPWGITPCTHPSEVVAVVDRMPDADRWRGYGYLFGYPADAVDFFVEAGLAIEDENDVGPGEDRQFIQIPTYASKRGRFTYAVPVDHERSAADKATANEAKQILGAYTQRRVRMQNARSMIAELRRLNQKFESRAISAVDVRDFQHGRKEVMKAVLGAH